MGTPTSYIHKATQDLPEDFEIPTLVNEGLQGEDEPAEEPAEGDPEGEPEPEPKPEPKPAEEPEGEPEPEPEPEPAEDPDADRLAHIAESEQEIRETRAQLKQKEKELEAQAQALKEQGAAADNALEAIRKDPFGTLERAGVSFDSLLDHVTKNEGKIPKTVPKPPEEEMPAWAKRLEEKVDKVATRDTDATAEANNEAYRQATDALLADEKFAILSTMKGARDVVFNLACQHAQQTGQALPPETVAATLQEEWKAQLEALPGHNTAREVLGLEPLESGEEPKPTTPPKRKKTKPPSTEEEDTSTSLGNDMTPASRPKQKPKSRDEALRLGAQNIDKEGGLWGAVEDEDYDDED